MWEVKATVAGLSFQAALNSMDILQTLVLKKHALTSAVPNPHAPGPSGEWPGWPGSGLEKVPKSLGTPMLSGEYDGDSKANGANPL